MKNKKNSKYPEWVCQKCGQNASTKGQFNLSTWHIGTCDVCSEEKNVTEPRDFFYPDFKPLKAHAE